jgi:hypothetical protein
MHLYIKTFQSKDAGSSTLVRVDSTLGAHMKVPCWEPALSSSDGSFCADPLLPPLTSSSSSSSSDQMMVGGTWYKPALITSSSSTESDVSGSNYFITASPAALLGECNNQAYDDLQYVNTLQQCQRTFDLDGIVKTIRSCKTSVDLSVMDFFPRLATLPPFYFFPVVIS